VARNGILGRLDAVEPRVIGMTFPDIAPLRLER
jgi:hypothetical protein